MKTFALITLTLLITLTSQALELPKTPFVKTKGYAHIKIPPTDIYISFDVHASSKTSEKGLLKLSDQRSKIFELLFKTGLKNKNFSTDKIQKSSVYEKNEKGYDTDKVIGYEFTQSYSIHMTDFKLYPKLMVKLYEQDEITSLYPNFTSNKQKEKEDELLVLAVKEARKKADKLTAAAGTEVTGVFAISETNFSNYLSEFVLNDHSRISYSTADPSNKLEDLIKIPESLYTSARVHIIFKIK